MEGKMEHRMNMRIPMYLPVGVNYPVKGGRAGFRAVSRDLSFGGAFIEIGDTAPSTGAIVRLSFQTPLESSITVDALVLRGEADGFSVMFAYYGDEVFRQLTLVMEPAFERHYAYDRH